MVTVVSLVAVDGVTVTVPFGVEGTEMVLPGLEGRRRIVNVPET